jgi:hypothetical protein
LLEDELRRRRREANRQETQKGLTAFEVWQTMVEGNIKNLIELQALAFEQKEEGIWPSS